MGTGKVDLVEKFGREEINVHDVFTSAPASTAFLRAYAFNESKSISQKKSFGSQECVGMYI
ncbi:hypothetical protein F444_12212 [Phytophthora nicotianae P1976]|uniref:Uncharacterized protein n=1 Tax=Phytophthora nicotianae P1976 TaxID=1317066 RepID=A0A080ZXV3_PHYNI|nr:hypothetical protein F444_12212 [Phytophthora nicotianae P1976]